MNKTNDRNTTLQAVIKHMMGGHPVTWDRERKGGALRRRGCPVPEGTAGQSFRWRFPQTREEQAWEWELCRHAGKSHSMGAARARSLAAPEDRVASRENTIRRQQKKCRRKGDRTAQVRWRELVPREHGGAERSAD